MGAILHVHGYSFELDTMNWSCPMSAGECEHKISDWLTDQTKETIQKIHEFRSHRDHWELEPTFEEVRLQQVMDAIWLDVTSGWAKRPDTGHNFELYAS